MAADVGEHVVAPVLKVGVAIIPLLHQAGRAEAEVAELSGAIATARHQAAVVEALVIFDSDDQISRPRLALDPGRLPVLHHQRLDGENMLIGLDRRHYDVIVQLVRYRHHHDLTRRHPADRLAI